MFCPNCNHPTQAGHPRCGHCNFKLPAVAPLAAAAPNSIACWNCRCQNTAEAVRCAQCNARLAATPAAAPRPAVNRSSFTTPVIRHEQQ